jgi:hypothetical protein
MVVTLSEANHDWTMLRLQDFKSIGEYNHVIHKICARLRICEKEPSEADKIKKTFQTMLPSDRILQHQYRAKNYQTYSDLVHDLLQAEKYDELTLRNHHQCFIGSAPLSEVHYNVKGNKKGDGSNNHQFFLVNSRRANITTKTRRTETKVKGKAKTKTKTKARHLHAINVVSQTTWLESAEHLNIWLSCTKDP